SNFEPSIARRVSEFLTTLNQTCAWRARPLSSVICDTLKPRYSASTAASAPWHCCATSATTALFCSRLRLTSHLSPYCFGDRSQEGRQPRLLRAVIFHPAFGYTVCAGRFFVTD